MYMLKNIHAYFTFNPFPVYQRQVSDSVDKTFLLFTPHQENSKICLALSLGFEGQKI